MNAFKKNKTKAEHSLTVIERFMLPNPMWQEGYRAYNHLFGKPLGWIYLVYENGEGRLERLDRKGNCSFYAAGHSNQKSCQDFLVKYASQIVQNEGYIEEYPSPYRCAFGKSGMVFVLKHLGRIKGVLILCTVLKIQNDVKELMATFEYFLQSQVELAYKTFELNNFYETVHPRALALSTMHSVHRVISSSLRLNELLPRIGRLCAQVLKASGCSIMLMDASHEHLVPFFAFGAPSKHIHHQRMKVGRGLEGHIAETGEFYYSRTCVAVPFIEEDIVGVITLWKKADRQVFTKTDLEILKSLSEQAVVAIKNAQLYEETEQLTLGSIKTINEVLELNFQGDRKLLPIFAEMTIEVGKELALSSKELTYLERAVLLLDTGTLALPDKVWRKKGKLTKREFEQVKRIPLRGANLLRSISSLKPIIPIIRHYRERYDGKGYPEGLKGEEIPIGARIVAVVDSFAAMISKREYRATLSIQDAMTEVKAHRGTQFDPQVVDVFLNMLKNKNFLERLALAQKASQLKAEKTSRTKEKL